MIFVFGSNEAGIHGGGAAYFAMRRHGALKGRGVGRQGNAYAIPTMDSEIEPLPIEKIAVYIRDFLDYARAHAHEEFQVTAVGCGIAGFTHEEIAPLFKDAPPNCLFDEAWKSHLGPSKKYWGTY
jgi:O-acetyl-ADP-ribose deacetylase (regulator of RNase III)